MSSLKVLDYRLKRHKEIEGMFALELEGVVIIFREYHIYPEDHRVVCGWGGVGAAIITAANIQELVNDLMSFGVPYTNVNHKPKPVVN